MSKVINLEIKKTIFPKLFNLKDDKLNETILYLLSIGYQQIYSSVNEKNVIKELDNICRKFKDDIVLGVDSKNELIKSDIKLLASHIDQLNIDNKFEELNKILSKLFGISNSSSKKGEISEQLIYNMIEEKYPNYSYDVKRHIPHHADGELISPTGMKCLVEIKNYTSTVHKDEIDKFKYDLKFTNNNLGIFISLQTGIAGRKNIDYETYKDGEKDYHIIYIAKIMNESMKLDCGILLLENIHKIIKKDNIDLKIDQIKHLIYQNFNELEILINKTDSLRNEYDQMEKNVKNNLDGFYNHLRNYEIEIKQKMQKIWTNLFVNLKDIDKNYIDMKTNILVNIGKKDKCYLIMSRLFDFFNKIKINIIQEDNVIYLNKNGNNVGTIKKMKDKVQINIDERNIFIVFKYNDNNLDTNIEFLNLLLK